MRETHDGLSPYAMTGRNLNFTVVDQNERTQRIQAASGDNFARLIEVKTRYDPANLFRVNNNIPPA